MKVISVILKRNTTQNTFICIYNYVQYICLPYISILLSSHLQFIAYFNLFSFLTQKTTSITVQVCAMMHCWVGSLIREMRTRGPELWVWMGNSPFNALATYLSLQWAVGWSSQGGLWLWYDQSLWSCIMWVLLDFSQATDIAGMPLQSYKEFRDKTGGEKNEERTGNARKDDILG